MQPSHTKLMLPDLPIELVFHVASFLTPHSLHCLSQTCRRFRGLRTDLGLQDACARRSYPTLVASMEEWNRRHGVAKSYKDLFLLNEFSDLLANVPRVADVLFAIRDTSYETEAERLNSLLRRIAPLRKTQELRSSLALLHAHEGSDVGSRRRRRTMGTDEAAKRTRREKTKKEGRRVTGLRPLDHSLREGPPPHVVLGPLMPQRTQMYAEDADDEGYAALAMLFRCFSFEKTPASLLEGLNEETKGAGREWSTPFVHFFLRKFVSSESFATKCSLRLFLSLEAIRSYHGMTEPITAEYLRLQLAALQTCRHRQDSATADAILLCLWNRSWNTAQAGVTEVDPSLMTMGRVISDFIVQHLVPTLGVGEVKSFHKKVSAVFYVCKVSGMGDAYATIYFERLVLHATATLPFHEVTFLINLPEQARHTMPEERMEVFDWVKRSYDQVDWRVAGCDYFAFVAIFCHDPSLCNDLVFKYFQARENPQDIVWAMTNLVQWEKHMTFEPQVYHAVLEVFLARVHLVLQPAEYKDVLSDLAPSLGLSEEEVATYCTPFGPAPAPVVPPALAVAGDEQDGDEQDAPP